ncbi:MAG: Hpt domain-containing protein [Bacillota bacterium]|nr:Hpt domain-containing protein [Bacillota bacterium]
MEQLFKYDIEGLAKELDVEIDEILVLFMNYISEMNDEIKSMKLYFANKDWNMLERIIHNIKGVSANLSINDVYQTAAAFDLQLKQGKTEDAGNEVSKLEETILSAKDEIIKFFTIKGYTL